MDGWNTTFLLAFPIFRGYVSFREGRPGCFRERIGSLAQPSRSTAWNEAQVSHEKRAPGCLGDLLGVTTQLYRDYNKP